MPTVFSHAAVGASLALLLPRGRSGVGIVLALAALAAAPDLDVIGFWAGIPYAHPLGHRGLSHSLFFALLVAGLSLPVWRRRLGQQAWLGAAAVFTALASHGLMDAFTDAGLGIGLLLPFDDTRYFAPWRPIETSPLSIGAFFSMSGLAIIGNELLFVGLPTLLFLGIVVGLRRRKPRLG